MVFARKQLRTLPTCLHHVPYQIESYLFLEMYVCLTFHPVAPDLFCFYRCSFFYHVPLDCLPIMVSIDSACVHTCVYACVRVCAYVCVCLCACVQSARRATALPGAEVRTARPTKELYFIWRKKDLLLTHTHAYLSDKEKQRLLDKFKKDTVDDQVGQYEISLECISLV